MDHTPDAFAAELASGDPDRVNRAINAVDDMAIEKRAALFDACFQRCRECYESGDGYQRQSAVRFADALYPQLGLRTVGATPTDKALPGEWTCSEIATHRRRLREFYLAALVDDDGRVRQAAARGLKQLAVTADLMGADGELETMRSELERLAEGHDDAAVQTHIDQAYEDVVFHAEQSESFLPDSLQGALD